MFLNNTAYVFVHVYISCNIVTQRNFNSNNTTICHATPVDQEPASCPGGTETCLQAKFVM